VERHLDVERHQQHPPDVAHRGADLDGPCPAMERMGCCPDGRPDEEFPCPEPKQRGYCPDAECPCRLELEALEHRHQLAELQEPPGLPLALRWQEPARQGLLRVQQELG